MSDPLVVLGEQLFQAARRIEGAPASGRDAPQRSRAPDRRGHSAARRSRNERGRGALVGRSRRLRPAIFAVGALLATTAVTLAAAGVIPTGRPVRPEELRNPRVGEGLPRPGASRLLPLRVADTAGGLPWGMRLVRTTREDLCVQIGHVQKDGELGALGVDGAFRDDGRFHPIPPAALPADSFRGHIFGGPYQANDTTSCMPSSGALTGEHRGVARSAANTQRARNVPAADVRDIYYGILGPQAVSVTDDIGGRVETVPVLPPLGAYLIVVPANSGAQGYSSTSVGAPGALQPAAPLIAITYRLDGKLCQRALSSERAGASGVHRCPQLGSPAPSQPIRSLHEPIHARNQVSHGRVTGVDVSFAAPFAVTSARQRYEVGTALGTCPSSGGTVLQRPGPASSAFAGEWLGRDVNRGSEVTVRLGDPFGRNRCGNPRRAEIEAWYDNGQGSQVLIGSVEVSEPLAAQSG
jgi:hypothetical protein